MGHIRLGRLPKTKPWLALFANFETNAITASSIAEATGDAVADELSALKGDRAFNFVFWTLLHVVNSAREPGAFDRTLKQLGLDQASDERRFMRALSDATARELRLRHGTSPIHRFAELALRDVVGSLLRERTASLFDSVSSADYRDALRAASTKKHFGDVSREFFSKIVSRTISFIADKEASNHVGPGTGLKPADLIGLHRDIDRYSYEAARIVEEFAGGWLSKARWETKQNITERDAQRFSAYALEKLSMELRQGRR